MTPERWKRVRDLMEGALEVRAGDQADYLDRCCGADADLRLEVESLLAAHDDAGTFLDEPAIGMESAAGEGFGPYRILREVGQGGMGTVYLADAVDKEDQVAIKVAHEGLPPFALRRFRIEHRILSRLEDSRIARVLDTGVTEKGRPFFVMDYLDGVPVDAYCEQHGLSVVESLELFLQVCGAVQAAHIQGVIHRDIKPSNVLVTPEGEPWLLDFGIAKLLDSDDQNITVDTTLANERLLTPQYASPEQIMDDEITAQTDVYSLGTLLYKLLTGRLPFKLSRYTVTGMATALETQSPARPSERVEGPWLPGLDEIVLKAIHRDRSGRYESVGDLMSDLEKCLEGRPTLVVHRVPLRAWAMKAAGLLLILLIVWLGRFFPTSILGDRALSTPLAKGDEIAIGEFRNLTGDPVLGLALVQAIEVGFNLSPHFRVYNRHHLRSAILRLQKDPTSAVTREVGLEIGRSQEIEVLVLGELSRRNETYHIAIEVIACDSGEILVKRSANVASEDQLIANLGTVIFQLRRDLGEPQSSQMGGSSLEKVLPENPVALRSYALAADESLELRYVEAVPLLERALDLEPDFAMATADLAVAYNHLRRPGSIELALRALESPMALTPLARLMTENNLAFWIGPWEEVVRLQNTLTRRYPHYFAGHFQLGYLYWTYSPDYAKAATALENAYTNAPDIKLLEYSLSFLTRVYIVLEDRSMLQKTLGRFPEHGRLELRLQAQALVAILDRDYESAEAALEEVRLMNEDRFVVPDRYLSMLFYADQGLLQKAVENAVESFAGELSIRVAAMGHTRQAGIRQLLDKAFEGIRTRRTGPNQVYYSSWSVLGKVLARHGDIEKARWVVQGLEPLVKQSDWPCWRSFWQMLEGEILLAEGRNVEALNTFKAALATQETFQIHESLAEAYERVGDLASAIKHREWLFEHRGRALVDSRSSTVVVRNVIDWNLASLRLAELYEGVGEPRKAIIFYQRFLGSWKGDNPPFPRRDAERQLANLLGRNP